MKNYFTISEFAKLRGININSLRYYEKLGILKPAYVDEKTNYRYYSPEQVSVLNKIILCVNLGIPLKEMTEYIDEDGNLQSQKLLERGKIEAQKRIEEMQNNLNFIEASLQSIEDNKKYENQKGQYLRKIEERKVIITEFYSETLGVKEMLSKIGEIYKFAHENNLFPVLPAGQIWEINEAGEMRYCLFLEIMNHQKEYERIVTLPKGEYACLQVDLSMESDMKQIIDETWGEDVAKTIIVDNVVLEKFSFKTRPSELQRVK